MGGQILKRAIAPGLFVLALGAGGAAASPLGAVPAQGLSVGSAVVPAAMCGYSCRSGGRYVPGPPDVCYERGMQYCGSSRDSGPRVVVPGVGSVELGGRPRRENCRTITIERDDGSVRRVRRCD